VSMLSHISVPELTMLASPRDRCLLKIVKISQCLSDLQVAKFGPAHSGFYENALYKFTFTYLLTLLTWHIFETQGIL